MAACVTSFVVQSEPEHRVHPCGPLESIRPVHESHIRPDRLMAHASAVRVPHPTGRPVSHPTVSRVTGPTLRLPAHAASRQRWVGVSGPSVGDERCPGGSVAGSHNSDRGLTYPPIGVDGRRMRVGAVAVHHGRPLPCLRLAAKPAARCYHRRLTWSISWLRRRRSWPSRARRTRRSSDLAVSSRRSR
jgi:hypothetical protein